MGGMNVDQPLQTSGGRATRDSFAHPGLYVEALCEALRYLEPQAIVRIAQLLVDAAKRGSSILLAGNGGSALTASHLHVDLIAAFADRLERCRVINLVESPGLLTALGNDFGFENSLSLQVEALGRRRDVLIAFSVSGESPNIIAACEAAKGCGMVVVGVTGFGHRALARKADIAMGIPSSNYGVVEDVHQAVCHMLAQSIRAL